MNAQLGSRALFSALSIEHYLNHAAMSPVCDPVREAVSRSVLSFSQRGVAAVEEGFAQRDQFRQQVSEGFHLQPADVAFPPGTTRGLTDLANAIALKQSDEIICFQGEFPANVLPWKQAAQRSGATVSLLCLKGYAQTQGAGLQELEERLRGGRVRLVAVSAVQFNTGLKMPLQQMGALCERFGAHLIVDGVQALGVTPVDLSKVSAMVSGSHKWLMGLDGLAIAVASERLRRELRPQTAGWLSVEEPLDFLFEGAGKLRYNKAVRADLAWMEGGVQTSAAFAALHTSYSLLSGLGFQAIHDHVQGLIDPLEEGLAALGFESKRSALPARRSAILSVKPRAGETASQWVAQLASEGVSVSSPDGLLRFSPHYCNSLDQIEAVLEIVGKLA